MPAEHTSGNVQGWAWRVLKEWAPHDLCSLTYQLTKSVQGLKLLRAPFAKLCTQHEPMLAKSTAHQWEEDKVSRASTPEGHLIQRVLLFAK